MTLNADPVADLVPHGRRDRWLRGGWLAAQLAERQADAALSADLESLAGRTVDELLAGAFAPRPKRIGVY